MSEIALDLYSGFVQVPVSTLIDPGYTLGERKLEENEHVVQPDKRSLMLPGVQADQEYTVEVYAFRKVDPDIKADRLITSVPRLAPTSPYQPASTVIIGGQVIVGGNKPMRLDELVYGFSDLTTTYGNTASSLANANAAAGYASTANTAKTNAETAKTQAEAARTAAQSAQTLAESAKTGAETARTNAQTAQGLAESAKTDAQAARTAADNAKTAAASSASDALASKGAANTSAQQASGYKDDAASSASAASASLTAAQTQANNAKDSATAAASSASAASTSSDTATQKASAASDSATTASTKAGEASTSAGNASTSASNAASSASDANSSKSAAATSASQAATSATNAGNSATAANTSAGAASISATNAGNSATAANTSATNAASSYSGAAKAALVSGQRDFTDKGLYYTTSGTAGMSAANIPDANFRSVSGVGNVYFNATTTTAFPRSKNAVPNVSGKTYRVTAIARALSAAGTLQLYFLSYSDTAQIGNITNNTAIALPSGGAWMAYTFDYKSTGTSTNINAQAAVTAGSGGSVELRALYMEDVSAIVDSAASATAAATSASNASTSATNAGQSATTATTQATNASTSAGNASTYANNASTSATNAKTSETNSAASASTATTQAGVASTSANAATATVLATVPSTMSGRGDFWTLADQSPTNATSNWGTVNGETVWTGNVNSGGYYVVASSKGSLPITPGRRYKVQAQVSFYNGGTARAGMIIFNLDGSAGAQDGADINIAAGSAYTLVESNTFTASAGQKSIAPRVVITSGSYNVRSILLIDVTAQELAAGYADAAAGSASTASTKATEAGNSATSATGSANTAGTKAQNAADSATAAAGSASGAATSSTNAAQSASAAQSSNLSASASSENSSYLDVYAAYDFTGSNNNGFSINNNLTQTADVSGMKLTETGSDGFFYTPNISFAGTRYRRVIMDVMRTANRTGGNWQGELFWTNSGHTDSASYRAANLNAFDPPLNVRTQLTWDIPSAVNASDWINSTITKLRFDLDNGAGGAFTIYSIRIVGSDSLAPAKSATAAATSASNAAGSATAAGQSASAASTSATNASTSAGNASTSASNASTSATNAAGSANTASTQASNASTSATNAGNSATAASGSASTASTQAGNASNSATAASASATSALSYRDAAMNNATRNIVFKNNGQDGSAGTWNGGMFTVADSGPSGLGRTKVLQMGGGYDFLEGDFRSGNWAARRYRCRGWVKAQSGDSVGIGVHWQDTGGSSGLTYTLFSFTANAWTAFDVNIGPTPSNAVFGRPFMRHEANKTTLWTDITIEDVTDSVAAAGSATAAAGSATTASSKADAAAGSATAANTSATNASTSAGNASSSATAASGSATAASNSATSASTSATVASSMSNSAINKNSNYAAPGFGGSGVNGAQIGAIPPYWSVWAADGNPYMGKIDRVVSQAASPNCMQIDRAGNGTNSGIQTTLPGALGAGWYVLEADVTFEDGNHMGSGIHCNFGNGTTMQISFGADTDTNGRAGSADTGNRKFSKLFYNPSQSGATPYLYMMAGWSGFASGQGFLRTIWHKALLRMATQGEIDGRQARIDSAANSASITTLQNTVTSNNNSITQRATTLESRALAGGNLLNNTEFLGTGVVNGWAFSNPKGRPADYVGVNNPSTDWYPPGERVLTLHQSGRAGDSGFWSGPGWVPDRVAVVGGQYYQLYAYLAAHRAKVEMALNWYAADGGTITTNYTGGVAITEGGKDPAAWTQVGWKAIQAPPGAVGVQMNICKWDTNDGQSDSWMWLWRPYIGSARQGQTEWNPWAPGNGRVIQESVIARVTTAEGTLATVAGRTEAYSVKEVIAGGASAFISFRAKDDNGNYTSDVSLGASTINLYNSQSGSYRLAMQVSGGNALFTGGISAGAYIRLGSGQGWPVALAQRDFNVTDGGYIDFGTNLGNVPDFTFQRNNLRPLNTGETYQLYIENPTATGGTVRARIITPATPTNVSLTNDYAGSGPTRIMDKGSNPDATDGSYQMVISGSVTGYATYYQDDGCVWVDAITYQGDRMGDLVVGDDVLILVGENNLRTGPVRSIRFMHQPCVRITTQSGIQLTCSTSTPIDWRDGTWGWVTEALGRDMAVMDEGHFRWEPVVSIEDMGMLEVAVMNCRDNTFAAGDVKGRQIFTHNATVNKQ